MYAVDSVLHVFVFTTPLSKRRQTLLLCFYDRKYELKIKVPIVQHVFVLLLSRLEQLVENRGSEMEDRDRGSGIGDRGSKVRAHSDRRTFFVMADTLPSGENGSVVPYSLFTPGSTQSLAE